MDYSRMGEKSKRKVLLMGSKNKGINSLNFFLPDVKKAVPCGPAFVLLLLRLNVWTMFMVRIRFFRSPACL